MGLVKVIPKLIYCPMHYSITCGDRPCCKYTVVTGHWSWCGSASEIDTRDRSCLGKAAPLEQEHQHTYVRYGLHHSSLPFRLSDGITPEADESICSCWKVADCNSSQVVLTLYYNANP